MNYHDHAQCYGPGIWAVVTFTSFGHLIIENEMFELYIQIKNDQDYQVLWSEHPGYEKQNSKIVSKFSYDFRAKHLFVV